VVQITHKQTYKRLRDIQSHKKDLFCDDDKTGGKRRRRSHKENERTKTRKTQDTAETRPKNCKEGNRSNWGEKAPWVNIRGGRVTLIGEQGENRIYTNWNSSSEHEMGRSARKLWEGSKLGEKASEATQTDAKNTKEKKTAKRGRETV